MLKVQVVMGLTSASPFRSPSLSRSPSAIRPSRFYYRCLSSRPRYSLVLLSFWPPIHAFKVERPRVEVYVEVHVV